MALILDIADAVVNELNSAKFSLPFTAARAYAPRFDLSELATLTVTVVPKALGIAVVSRSARQREYQVDVAVQQRVAVADTGEVDPLEVDPLMALAQEIAEHFEALVVETDPEAVCTKIDNDPIYIPEHLRERRLFTSVLTLTFVALGK